VKSFRARGRGLLTARVEPVEAALLSQLATNVADLLAGNDSAEDSQEGYPVGDGDGAPSGRDPALVRLFPEAYPGDAEASSEFRRFTLDGLTDRKLRNARTVIATLEDATSATGTTEIRLDPQAAQAWVRTLTDIRLVLASRLGIDDEESEAPGGEPWVVVGDVYDWLGWVQDSLVSALED